ncbi:MAG: CvpA family protein [Marinifilaceae bacterium]
MNFLDIILAIPLLWAVYKGFTKGLIVEVATLLALVLGIYGALHFSDFTADFIREQLDYDSKYMAYISFVVTFLVIVIGVNLLGKLLDKLVEAVALGLVNRLLGIFFSLAKAVLILSILVNLLDRVDQRFGFISKEKKEKSFLYQPLNQAAEMIYDFFDFDFSKAGKDKKEVDEKVEELPIQI